MLPGPSAGLCEKPWNPLQQPAPAGTPHQNEYLLIMRKIYLLILSLALCAGAFAQQRTAEEFLQRYNTVSSRLGADGVGIETLITEWEAAYPEDINMLQAKWAYYYTKAATTTIVAMDQ